MSAGYKFQIYSKYHTPNPRERRNKNRFIYDPMNPRLPNWANCIKSCGFFVVAGHGMHISPVGSATEVAKRPSQSYYVLIKHPIPEMVHHSGLSSLTPRKCDLVDKTSSRMPGSYAAMEAVCRQWMFNYAGQRWAPEVWRAGPFN